jgi:hypothetical protein
MKRRIFLAIIIAALTMTKGFSGQPGVEETRNLKGFTSINFGVAGDLYINIGPEFKVVLEGDKSLLEDIITEVSGGKLTIKKDNWNLNMNSRVVVNITMPELDGLGVSGSGKAEIMDVLKANNIYFNVSGSGKIYVGNLEAEKLDCGISGSGDIIINKSGTVDNAHIGISGSGSYSGEALEIDLADIHISGSGNCSCNVKESLVAHVSGSGNVSYSGNPKKVDARVSGSGKVRSR